MIIRELYKTRTDGVQLYRTCSDVGMMIQQNETGMKYTEAIDVENAPYTYTEVSAQAESVYAEDALRIITGGVV